MQVTAEEYQGWLEHPVSQWVLAALAKGSEAQKAHWTQMSWEQGTADPLLLNELRTRADAYRAISEASYEDWCGTMEQVPNYGDE